MVIMGIVLVLMDYYNGVYWYVMILLVMLWKKWPKNTIMKMTFNNGFVLEKANGLIMVF